MAERAAAAGQHDPDTDLYALLHVSRDATEDDIKHAYRQWAQIYHPDKYQTVQMQDVATHHFQRIRFAYDVLSDEQKRQIYDIYGVEGLSSGLELGPHLRTHDDIRADFERTQKRKDVIRAAQHTNQTATLVVNVSAADMLRRFDCGPRITGFQMSSQVQAGLSDCDTVVLGGSMYARRGLGGGTALAMFRRQVSPEASWEVVGTAGLSNTLGFNTTRQLTSHVTATSGVTWHAAKGTFALNNSWSRQLSEGTTGTINLHTGEDPGVSVGWQSNGAKNSAGGDLKVGDGTFGLQGNFVRRFSAKSSGRVAARFGTGGVDVELGATRRISEHSSTGMSCVVGLQGVLWKIRYTRGSQKFIIPIVLSTTLRPAILLPALLLPPSIYALLRRYVLKPYGLRRKQRKELAARRANAETVNEARKVAMEAQQLLAAPAERKRRRQEERGGLVITRATYGNMRPNRPAQARPSEDGDGSGGGGGGGDGRGGGRGEEEAGGEARLAPPYLDVTVPLQFLVEDAGFLLLHDGVRKRGIMGFCDPCPGEERRLRVEYTMNGEPHKVVVGDFEELRIPQAAHKVPGGRAASSSVHQVD